MIDVSIFTLLKDSAGVAAIVSENSSPARFRIYPLVIPQQEQGDATYMPCVVYQKVGLTRGVTNEVSDAMVEATYQVDSYATQYLDAQTLADAARVALLDVTGTYGGHYIRRIFLQNEFAIEDPDPGLFRISQTYTVWFTE